VSRSSVVRPRPLLALVFAFAALLAVSPAAAPASGWHHGHHGHHGSYGATTLALDPAAVDALTGLGVTPAPIAPARALPSGELAFPITNSFRNALRTGVIRHSGGISLTAGSTTVNLEDFVIDPYRRVLTARVGDARLPILSLDFSHARVRFNGRRLTVGPVGGSLTAGAADALNAAFGLKPGTVPAGLKLGDATVRYRL
jgi:hypothetical protein